MSVRRKLLFSLIPASITWLVLEAGTTVFYANDLQSWDAPPPVEGGETPTMPGNPYLLYEYRPGRHLQAGKIVTINSMGLRGEEPEIPKPSGVRRIMTTGDSSIFGFGVMDDEVFSEVLATQLGEQVEAINAATPGYSSYQSINLLRLRALQTEPDLVVIGNLWSDNNFDAFIDKDLLASYDGYATSLVGRTRALLSVSAIFRVMDYRMRVRPAAERVGFGDTERILDQGMHIGLRRVAINDYAQNLQQLVDLAKSVRAEVVFLLPANNEDLADDGQNMKAWSPYRDVMTETASRNGAPLLDVPDLFRSSGLSRDELFVDEMHPSTQGHALIGQALTQMLNDANWMDGGRVMYSGTGGPIPTYDDPFVNEQSEDITNGNVADPGTADNPTPQGTVSPPPDAEPFAPADGGDPGPNPGGGMPDLGPTIQGELVFDNYTQGNILVEVFAASEAGGTPTVLGQDRLSKPGSFRVEVGEASQVVFRAYLDEDSDGPDADDRLVDLTSTTIDVSSAQEGRVVVNIDDSDISIEDQ